MHRYPAIWGKIEDPDGPVPNEYHLDFPNFPDCLFFVSSDLEGAMLEGEELLREFIKMEYDAKGLEPPKPYDFNSVDVPPGGVLLAIPLLKSSGHAVRVHMQLDEGVLAFIDGEAKRRKMTRTAYVEWMARRIAQMGG